MIEHVIRGILTTCAEEEAEAKKRFFDIFNRVDDEWPPPYNKIMGIIKDQYMLYGVPSFTTLKNVAKESSRDELHQKLVEIESLKLPTQAEFRQAVEKATAQILTSKWKGLLLDSSQILVTGKDMERVHNFGLLDSVRFLMSGAIELLGRMSPEQRVSTLKTDIPWFRDEYLKKRDDKSAAYGAPFGIDQIDEATKGIFLGELAVVAAFAGGGKTTTMMNMLHYQLVACGYNVYLWSGEMRKEQILRMLACIHSRRADFGDKPALDYERLKSGQLLSDEEEFFLNELTLDLQENPKHGELFIEPSDKEYPTLRQLWTRAEVINTMSPLDIMYIDYDRLLKPEKGRASRDFKENLNQTVSDMKQMAKSFAQGRMIRVVTAHQINRKGKEEADESDGVYSMDALADSNEVEKASDHIIATYTNESMIQRQEAKWTHLKNRDGRLVAPFYVYSDPPGRFIANLEVDQGDTTLI